MSKLQPINYRQKKPLWILALILSVFFLKGMLLTAILPIFNGYDEARHYNTIQYLAEPEKKNWPIEEKDKIHSGDLVQRFNYTEEIKETAKRIRCVGGELEKCDFYEELNFSKNFNGENEKEIDSRLWKRYNTDYPKNIAHGGRSFYHHILAQVEKMLDEKSILIRFYFFRILSVLFGTLSIFVFYLILKKSSFTEKHSLLLTAIISFHPRFSFYSAYINYDPLLILSFALFILSVVVTLRNGLNWKNFTFIIASVFLAILVKSTGLILLAFAAPLLSFLVYKKISAEKKILSRPYLVAVLSTLCLAAILFLKKYLPETDNLGIFFTSLYQFILKNLDFGLISLTSKTYWGQFPAVNWLAENFLYFIWAIETISIIGLVFFLFSKKKSDFLPEKKYILFFILFIIAMQLGIRLADWKYFISHEKLGLQTPGRYFFPTLVLHITLVFTGLGALLEKIKKTEYFNIILSSGLIAMILFFMYYLFNVLIPNFYL